MADQALINAKTYSAKEPPYDQEISLVEIWRILANHKKLILITTFLVTLAGSLYALTKLDVYGFSATIQLSTPFVDGREITIDDVKNAENKLKQVYLPLVLNDYYTKNPAAEKTIKIGVSVPKESKILIISCHSTEKDAAVYRDLINKAGTQLIENNNEVFKVKKKLAAEQLAHVSSRLQTLVESEKDLNSRIESFDKSFKSAPIDNGGTTALVITELNNQKLQMTKEKYALETLMLNIESDLQLSKEANFLSPFSQSVEPVGLAKKLIVLLSLLLGVIIGVVIALTLALTGNLKAE